MAQAFVSFLAIIDPMGNILVFYLFARHFGRQQKLLAAAIAVSASFLMLLVFALAGQEVLDFLTISPESFQVAAGLLLIPPAYRLVTEGQPARESERETSAPLDFALVPLATPLIAGPGALAATTSFSEQVGRGETLGAIALVLVITFVAFALADYIFRLVGAPFLRLMSRTVGIVLFAIAVDFIMDGLGTFIDAHNLALLPF